MTDWDSYHHLTQDNPPRPLLLAVLERVRASGDALDLRAIDLGCGAGQDSRELLSQGWEVYAIDQSAAAVRVLETSVNPRILPQLKTQAIPFEETRTLPAASLIYASLSLPFCRAEFFPFLWQAIMSALHPTGWFAADFFGPEDDWVKAGHVDGYPVQGRSRKDLHHLLADFTLLQCDERREQGCTGLNREKFWHVYSVVARRKQ